MNHLDFDAGKANEGLIAEALKGCFPLLHSNQIFTSILSRVLMRYWIDEKKHKRDKLNRVLE